MKKQTSKQTKCTMYQERNISGFDCSPQSSSSSVELEGFWVHFLSEGQELFSMLLIHQIVSSLIMRLF